MKVLKRNGKLEPFNVAKVIDAVKRAYLAKNKEVDVEVIEEIQHLPFTLTGDTINVDTVHDAVIRILMDLAPYDVALAYILYREHHNQARFIRERLDYMERYSSSSDNAATSSETDANANVTMKNVANLEGEVYKTTNRTIQRQRMKDKLNELYPEVAKQYEEDLNNHIIYTHDEASTPVLKYYCMAATLYPLMLDGVGNIDGVTPCAPNDIQSFSGQVTNLVFLLSSQCKGAVALGDYFIALNYYVVKEFGSSWYEKTDQIVTNGYHTEQHTMAYYIRKGMKQFIYGINQPAGNRSYNSPFTNVSYYDSYYFNSLFGEFCYPDGTKPEWKAIDKLQRMFMQLHRELRLIKPLTFPVSTMALVYDNNDYLDKEYKELCAEEWSKGGSFFLYSSDNPTSLASCCFSKDTKVLWKSSTEGVNISTLEELHSMKWEPYKKNLRIFHNGSWIKGHSISLPCKKMYKVTTFNNKEYYMTEDHINITLRGEIPTSQLTTTDYLMFNTKELPATPEQDEKLTFSEGFIIGAFLGDGSFGPSINDTIYETIISQNEYKKEETINRLSSALKHLGLKANIRVDVSDYNVYNIKCSCKELVEFIRKWTLWERGTHSYNKQLNLNCLLQSVDFRKGILAGWYATDGGNSNRCYTTSPKLVEGMEALITSLGMSTIINISDRTDEAVVIRGKSYNRNYPLYCVRWYSNVRNRKNKDTETSWIFRNNSLYFKIKTIEEVEYKDNVYCIECNDKEEPYFTLPSGLITHNCRVLNEITENTFSSTTGMTGVMTGSVNVITLNINRIIQDWWNTFPTDCNINFYLSDKHKGFPYLKKYLINILERVYKYHVAFKTMLYDMEDRGMFAASNGGYIYMKKLYSTIGIIGYCEAAKFLGLEVGNNKNYKEFLQIILGTIKEQNKLHSIKDKKRPFLFNSEAIPGENVAIKLYNWDKESGYYVPEDQNLYSCYFFSPWDNTSILDKIKLHGKEISKYTDGGLE